VCVETRGGASVSDPTCFFRVAVFSPRNTCLPNSPVMIWGGLTLAGLTHKKTYQSTSAERPTVPWPAALSLSPARSDLASAGDSAASRVVPVVDEVGASHRLR
jgi:hypothetical protein